MAADKMAATQEATEAEQHWLEAKKITHSMVKKLEQIAKDESGSKKLLADLESVEHLLETLRLACMATTFTDFKFAHKNRVLDRLWHVHTLISAEYKKGLQRHRGHGQIVQFRTIEKQYAKHLKTAQYFYKGFVERLSARYRLRPLQRVAHTMQSGNLKISEVIDAGEARLSHELTVACYRTVLHMGDIARYRLNASRQKGHSPDVALTYYALAQDLMPQEGDAHHQMAVVLADQRRDFDVVYHFLRSLSVRRPFTLASKNLASEFKKLLQPSSASRKQANTPPDPYEMFGSWFVRLHANYFKGEEFSSQGELEREVLHRWEALLKKAEQPTYLLKAVLMNIAAYDIALNKVKNEWTATGSQSCQFILRFMVQTILVLSRVLETETQCLFERPTSDGEAVPAPTPKPAPTSPANEKSAKANGRNRATNGSKAADNNKQIDKKNMASDTCLSLFRVSMAWIAVHHEDLVKFKEHLAPHVVEMHRSVTRCLSLFVELIATTEASPVPYLLPEDVEVIGLAPLDGWTTLRVSDASSAFKPRFDEEGVERKDATYETLARIYDIVECTVRLIGDPLFPWVLETAQEEDGREVTKIIYADDYVPSVSSSAPITSTAPALPAVPASFAAPTVAPIASPVSTALPAAMLPPPSSGNGHEARQLAQRLPEATQPVQFPASSVVVAQVGIPSAGPSTHQAARPPSFPRRVSYKDMDDDDFLPGSMRETPEVLANPTGYAAADPELDLLESAAYSRVENFLSPPELHPHLPQAAPAPLSSSYGMHTATVEDVFGQLQTPSIPGASSAAATATAATAKPIPSSPWGGTSYTNSLGYHPPQAPFGMGMESPSRGMGGLGNVPPGMGQQHGQPMRPPANIEEQLAFLTMAKQQERQFSAAAAVSSSSYGMDSLSRGFPSALSPVGAAKQPTSPSGGGNGSAAPGGFVNPWATGGGGSTSASNQNGSRLLPQQLQQAQAASLGIGGAMGMASQAGPGSGSSPAMLYSSNFTTNNALSSLPPVQSPRGLPPPRAQKSPPQNLGGGFFERTAQSMQAAAAASSPQQPFRDTYESIYAPQGSSSYQMQQQQQLHGLQRGQQLSPTSHLAAGNSANFGSGFGGFGDYGVGSTASNGNGSGNGAIGAPVDGPAAGTASSKWHDAATAWGRGTPLTKDDPTHFRNAVRQTGLMEDTNAYDRNALMSALYDGSKPAAQR